MGRESDSLHVCYSEGGLWTSVNIISRQLVRNENLQVPSLDLRTRGCILTRFQVTGMYIQT